ncbi:recombinase family protein [Priestia aryabhattai]|uniref:recombinase family protein n=1 Tax=Priestia aryabhattai TaxID=412384 RepID=UPI001C8DA0DA|nr:recombinase family protein [Priestia aryabhattai]MBY0077971.1 recombinase family protein [Priestia aryabhattai]
MKGEKFGYIRISSKDQNEARQFEKMKELGINERYIFIDKQSGKNFERPQYQLVKQMLREGDVLYLHSLDRFGRNKEQILEEWNELTKKRKVDIVVLDMPLLDTTQYRDSLGTFISDLVLQILSWLAEEERNKIRTRQKEGIDIALKRGIKFGREKVEITEEFKNLYIDWKAGRITAVSFMKQVNMKKSTFYNRIKEYEKSLGISEKALEGMK